MTVLKRYLLNTSIKRKYITANVKDRNDGAIVAVASSAEHLIRDIKECGTSANEQSAKVVGQVLAMRLKVVGLHQGGGRGIHVDLNKEIEKKTMENSKIETRLWALVNALKDNGVKIIVEGDGSGKSTSHQQ